MEERPLVGTVTDATIGVLDAPFIVAAFDSTSGSSSSAEAARGSAACPRASAGPAGCRAERRPRPLVLRTAPSGPHQD